jgi:hypothetical protein
MMNLCFASKDNEGNKNLLAKDRQAARGKFLKLAKG